MGITRRRLARLAALAAGLGAGLGLSGCSVGGPAPDPLPGTPEPMRFTYGSDPSQWAELHLPPGDAGALGVVVVLHGGFWRAAYGAELGTPLAVDLANNGVAAWNVEYRRVGNGGGWPATFEDVSAAADKLAALSIPAAARLDRDRVVTLGHSAGGHLATWLAGRPKLPAGAPGAGPSVRVRGVVSQAGVLDLVAADAVDLGGGAAAALLGGSAGDQPGRYQLASPTALLPLGVPVVCVHGTADRNVPLAQSVRYVRAARLVGDPAELVELAGADHFAVIDPRTDAWRRCRDAALRLLA
ncbi:MAG: alpha/beta hydrolase [Pseudonocardia sp.]